MRARFLFTSIASLVLVPSFSHAQWQPDGVAISASANYQTTQAIASDAAGGAIVTWHDFRSGTSYDIFAQRVDATGAVLWTTDGVPISTEAANQAVPSIVSDGAGGAIIAWSDDRTCCFNTDIYAQRIDASGTVLWTPNGVALCTAVKSQIRPEIVSDGAGGGDRRMGGRTRRLPSGCLCAADRCFGNGPLGGQRGRALHGRGQSVPPQDRLGRCRGRDRDMDGLPDRRRV